MAVALVEETPERGFERGAWPEGRVSSLGGDCYIAALGPAQASLAQPGTGGNDGDVALGVALPLVERTQVVWLQHQGAVGSRLQIVEQVNVSAVEHGRNFAGVDEPRQVDGADGKLVGRGRGRLRPCGWGRFASRRRRL